MTSAGQAPDLVFKGIDGNECEEFIAAIEELAFAEGWSRDRERMLLFARSRLRHKGLRWFARLDPSKKSDWDSFVEALFEQYPLVEAPEAEITTPVWSATTFSPGASTVILPSDHTLNSQQTTQDGGQAAKNGTLQSGLPNSRAYNPLIPGRHIGVLRIVVDEELTPPQYIWHGRRLLTPSGGPIAYEEKLGTTMDHQEALLVCFLQSSEPHPIGCLNTTPYTMDLSLCFQPCGTNSYMLRAASGAGKPQGTNGVQNVSKVWNVLAEGTVQATLPEFDPSSRGYNSTYTKKEDFKTTEVHLDTSGSWISFVKPGTPLRQASNNDYDGRPEVKARIVLEPL